MTTTRGQWPVAPEEQSRLNRQAELLRLLNSGNEPTQWIALKELGKIGDEAVAAELFRYTLCDSPDVAAAARIAYRQLQERLGLAAPETVEAADTPPRAAIRRPPPPPPPRDVAPEGHSDPVFTAADYGQDDGRTDPLPVSAEPFGAPVVDPQEAALLPDDQDLGLLPQ